MKKKLLILMNNNFGTKELRLSVKKHEPTEIAKRYDKLISSLGSFFRSNSKFG